MKKIFAKPTLFLFLGIVLILIGFPYGIYGLTLSGGASLGGVLILTAVVIVFAFLVVDRILARKINNKKLSIYEMLVILIAMTFYFYYNRTLKINIEDQNSKYIIVIENSGNLQNDKLFCEFPFNKSISTAKNYIVVEKVFDNIEVKTPKNWGNSYYYNSYKFEKYHKIKVFAKIEMKINQSFIDSLVATDIR